MKNMIGRPMIKKGYLTNRAWLTDVVGNREDLILCYTSALEFLEFFVGYLHDERVDVYAMQKGTNENINYHVVEDIKEVDVVKIDGVFCTSINQTINDMLEDIDNADEQALIEGLGDYYYLNNESFDNLVIKPKNMKRFNIVKNWAIESCY